MTDPFRPHVPRTGRRLLAYAVLAAVLALGFWGYLTPDMKAQWETLAALCGF